MIKGCSDGRKFDRKVGMDENEGRAEEGGYYSSSNGGFKCVTIPFASGVLSNGWPS